MSKEAAGNGMFMKFRQILAAPKQLNKDADEQGR
jgi:hypothetical protein